MLKTTVKILRSRLLTEKMRFENISPILVRFLKFQFDYDLNLCRYFMSVLEPRVTSNARLRFSIFSKPSYFCMWNFVAADKARLTLSPETMSQI